VKPDYGLDFPRRFRSYLLRGASLIFLALGLWWSNREAGRALVVILLFIGLGYLLVAAVMFWSSRVAKLKVRDEILNKLPWRGDEKVLDVGCGGGVFLIGAAKRLNKSGRATGVDVSQPEAALANAKAEGVADRVRMETADPRKLSYPNASFDTVVSSLALHNISSSDERAAALSEMIRVLKPGGHIAILDTFHTAEYARQLQNKGLTNIELSNLRLLWMCPTRHVTAKKPI
jgi:arsenite methyltransferase